MNTHRSNYKQTIKVLKEMAAGLSQNEIKSKLFLSRYSYNYTVNRFLENDLVEYKDGELVPSRKGYGILKFEQKCPDKTADNIDLKVIATLHGLKSLEK